MNVSDATIAHRAAGSATGMARFSKPAVLVYVLLHLGCLGVLYVPFDRHALAIFCAAYLIRGFGVSVVYHRYFAHRAFRTSRPMQFVLGVYGATTVLGGLLWWAQTHREHHRHADTPEDIHSPRHQGFAYAHCGWFLTHAHRTTDPSKVADLVRFPELVFLERWDAVFKLLYIACAYWWFGVVGVVWGFFVPTVVVIQMVHWIQSVSHSLGGYRRYPTADDSRNHWMFGVVSMGEGFHHNHHSAPGSARLGHRWWEIDVGYYLLVGLSRLGLIWDLRVPAPEVHRARDGRAERHAAVVHRDDATLATPP
jgi:stearoyl-CoA desaturase (delta-9 desaturase)